MELLAATLGPAPATTQALVSITSAGRGVSEIEQISALKILQVSPLPHSPCALCLMSFQYTPIPIYSYLPIAVLRMSGSST